MKQPLIVERTLEPEELVPLEQSAKIDLESPINNHGRRVEPFVDLTVCTPLHSRSALSNKIQQGSSSHQSKRIKRERNDNGAESREKKKPGKQTRLSWSTWLVDWGRIKAWSCRSFRAAIEAEDRIADPRTYSVWIGVQEPVTIYTHIRNGIGGGIANRKLTSWSFARRNFFYEQITVWTCILDLACTLVQVFNTWVTSSKRGHWSQRWLP